MENRVFSQPAVVQRFERMVLAKLYTDRGTPEDESNRKLQQDQFGFGLPYYAVIDPDGTKLAVLGGRVSIKRFTEFLDNALQKWDTRNSAFPKAEAVRFIGRDRPSSNSRIE